MSAHAVGPMTPDEFLASVRSSEFRSEYFNGEVFAMSGGTDAHGFLCAKAIHLLIDALEGKPCHVAGSNLMVQTGAREGYCFPDVVVVCGKSEYADERKDIITNPVLVIEVLSPSTEKWDRGGKFDYYRRLSSLRDYVLISQDEMRVEWFSRRDNGDWIFHAVTGPEGVVDLESVNATLPLARLYKNIEFA